MSQALWLITQRSDLRKQAYEPNEPNDPRSAARSGIRVQTLPFRAQTVIGLAVPKMKMSRSVFVIKNYHRITEREGYGERHIDYTA